MNRQAKRMMQRQKAAEERVRAQQVRRPVPAERKKRVPPRQFLKEVRQELNKVDWPTRKELGTYTVVVLATVIVLTAFVFALDLGFSKAIVNILGS